MTIDDDLEAAWDAVFDALPTDRPVGRPSFPRRAQRMGAERLDQREVAQVGVRPGVDGGRRDRGRMSGRDGALPARDRGGTGAAATSTAEGSRGHRQPEEHREGEEEDPKHRSPPPAGSPFFASVSGLRRFWSSEPAAMMKANAQILNEQLTVDHSLRARRTTAGGEHERPPSEDRLETQERPGGAETGEQHERAAAEGDVRPPRSATSKMTGRDSMRYQSRCRPGAAATSSHGPARLQSTR